MLASCAAADYILQKPVGILRSTGILIAYAYVVGLLRQSLESLTYFVHGTIGERGQKDIATAIGVELLHHAAQRLRRFSCSGRTDKQEQFICLLGLQHNIVYMFIAIVTGESAAAVECWPALAQYQTAALLRS